MTAYFTCKTAAFIDKYCPNICPSVSMYQYNNWLQALYNVHISSITESEGHLFLWDPSVTCALTTSIQTSGQIKK